MAWRRSVWMGMTLLILTQGQAQAQPYSLQEDKLDGQSFHIRMEMDLKGKITVKQEGKPVEFPHLAKARHEYYEHVLEARDSVAVRTARHYQKAEATFSDGKESERRPLRPELCDLLVAHRIKDQTVVYHPRLNFTQRDLELTEHFDSLHLAGLLAGKSVAVGDTWKVPVPVVQATLDFDGLIEHDLTGKLDEVTGDLARFSVVGKAKGIDMGTEVNVLVKAKGEFDLKKKRFTSLVWEQTDQREQGPVSPALSADVTIKIRRDAIEEPKELNNFARVRIPDGPPTEEKTTLTYRDDQSRFSFQHGRDWHLVGNTKEQVVFRLLERGDFVAQVTFMPWKKVAPEKMLTVEEFADLMNQAPAWKAEKLLEKSKIDVPGDLRVVRVGAEGTLDERKVVQFFYLVGSSKGEQMIVTFTMNPEQVQKLDTRDLAIIRSIRTESMMTAEPTARRD